MKALKTTIELAKVMGKEGRAAGLTSIVQNADMMFMLSKYSESAIDLINAYVSGFNSKN